MTQKIDLPFPTINAQGPEEVKARFLKLRKYAEDNVGRDVMATHLEFLCSLISAVDIERHDYCRRMIDVDERLAWFIHLLSGRLGVDLGLAAAQAMLLIDQTVVAMLTHLPEGVEVTVPKPQEVPPTVVRIEGMDTLQRTLEEMLIVLQAVPR